MVEHRLRARLLAAAFALAAVAGGCTRAAPGGAGTASPPDRARDPVPTSVPARVSREPCGTSGRTVAFRVSVSKPLDVSKREFARHAREILCDRRSWIASGAVRFRYDPDGSLLIGLRTPNEAEERCFALIRLSVNRFYSCGTRREVVINSDRWLGNSPYFPASLATYRRMLMNHEVGHALRLHHQSCPRDGAKAPVMMQQSKGMNLNGRTCRPNPWPLRSELARL